MAICARRCVAIAFLALAVACGNAAQPTGGAPTPDGGGMAGDASDVGRDAAPEGGAAPESGTTEAGATDAAACATDCAPTPLSQLTAFALAVDPSNVYFTSDSSVVGVAKSGGAPFVVSSLFTADAGSSMGVYIALDQGTLYWCVSSNAPNLNLSFDSAPVSARNATPTLVWGAGANQSQPTDRPVGFVVSNGKIWAGGDCNYVFYVPTSGATQATVPWSDVCSGNSWDKAFALDDANGYAYLLAAGNIILRVHLADGAVTQLHLPGTTALAMTLWGGSLYGLSQDATGNATLQVSAPDGSGAHTVAQNLPGSSNRFLVVDGTGAYYASLTNPNAAEVQQISALIRVDLQTGASSTLYTTAPGVQVFDLVTDNAYAYLALGGAGVVRVGK
jgi:hypothetical protein